MIYPSQFKKALNANNVHFLCDEYGKITVKDSIIATTSDEFVDNMFSFLADIKTIDSIQSKFNKMTAYTDGADLVVVCYINTEIRTYRLRNGKITGKDIKELT
jgi:hypothetical protein